MVSNALENIKIFLAVLFVLIMGICFSPIALIVGLLYLIYNIFNNNIVQKVLFAVSLIVIGFLAPLLASVLIMETGVYNFLVSIGALLCITCLFCVFYVVYALLGDPFDGLMNDVKLNGV